MPRSRADSHSRVTLPIVPMLDMTFQLLFFAIMNFHPASTEGQFDVALPIDADRQPWIDNVPKGGEAEKDLEPEFPSELTVKVWTRIDGVNDGEISQIGVRNIEGKEEPIDGVEGLKKYLTERAGDLTHKETIKVQGDRKLKVRNIMKVMDACRQAGFKNVSFIPPEDLGR
jgi:biopolymer transport protein ExbD